VAGGNEVQESNQVSATAWDFSLSDLEGRTHSKEEWQQKRGVVLFFLGAECPISNRYSPEINRIVADYGAKKFAFYGVQSDPEDSARSEALKAVENFGYRFPILLDPFQNLARRARVTMTPEVAVFSPTGELLYHGRIDDLYIGFGKFRGEPTRRDLRLTLDAISDGRPAPNAETKAVGCYLPPAAKEP
jgi:peroxiredoxin